MEDAELKSRLDALEQKLNATFVAADKTRKYMLWAGIISAILIVLPLIGIFFAAPSLMSSYGQLGALQL
jgi:hypothetical protein